MPVLKSPRHERFAQELAKGKTAIEAYEAAGYKPDRGAASRLSANVSVSERVAELQQRGAARVEVTVQSLLQEAEEARQLALSMGQASAAVAATREKGILSGKRVERSEVGRPGEFESMSDDELDAFIASRKGSSGASHSGTRAANGQAGVRGKSSGLH